MARKPQKPQKGQPAIKELYNSVCDIIDYLPSLEVTGDQKSTYVTKSSAGTVIHATQNESISVKSNKYLAGSGIIITSGNVINTKLSGGANINVYEDNGYIVISGTPEGSGGGPGSDTTYTGQYNQYSSGWIYVDSSGSNPHLISSNLRWIEQLYNYPLVASSNITMPNSLTACNNTVDLSQVGTVYSSHFIQTSDIFHDGVGTKINLSWYKNPFGSTEQGGTNGIVNGLQVDLTLSGGRYTDVILHKHVFGAYDPNTGTRYDPPTESRVDCLLTGTYDRYPHTSGYIDIVPVEAEDGKVWGVISTNLHGDGTTIDIDKKTGTISCKLDPGGGGYEYTSVTPSLLYINNSNHTISAATQTGGGGGGMGLPNYASLVSGASNNIFSEGLGSDHAAGWLRVSLKSATSCVKMTVGENDIHLGMGNYTGLFPIGANESVTFTGTGEIFAAFTPAVAGGLGPADYSKLYAGSSLSLNQQYYAKSDGWARVSLRATTSCVTLCVNGNHIELGTGNYTGLFPIPNGSTFGVIGSGDIFFQFDGTL